MGLVMLLSVGADRAALLVCRQGQRGVQRRVGGTGSRCSGVRDAARLDVVQRAGWSSAVQPGPCCIRPVPRSGGGVQRRCCREGDHQLSGSGGRRGSAFAGFRQTSGAAGGGDRGVRHPQSEIHWWSRGAGPARLDACRRSWPACHAVSTGSANQAVCAGQGMFSGSVTTGRDTRRDTGRDTSWPYEPAAPGRG